MSQPKTLDSIRLDAVPLANKMVFLSVNYLDEHHVLMNRTQRVISSMDRDVLDEMCKQFKPMTWASAVTSYDDLLQKIEANGVPSQLPGSEFDGFTREVSQRLIESTLQAPDWPALIGWYNESSSPARSQVDAFLRIYDLDLASIVGKANQALELPPELTVPRQSADFAGRTFFRDSDSSKWMREDKYFARFEIQMEFAGSGITETQTLGYAGSLTEAITKAQFGLSQVELKQVFENSDPEPHEPWAWEMSARRLIITEADKPIALANISYTGKQPRMDWVRPKTSDQIDQAMRQIQQYESEAREASRSDSYFTATQLRKKAGDLQLEVSLSKTPYASQMVKLVEDVTKKVAAYERRSRDVDSVPSL